MADNVDLSKSENTTQIILHVLKHFIRRMPNIFPGLKGLKIFDDIILKPSSSSFVEYTLDNLTADIEKLVASTKKKSNGKFKTSAQRLRKHWSDEVEEIRKCIDCYYYRTAEKEDSFFARLCTKPHLLVYVQELVKDGSRWWPAKVLTVNDDDNSVHIDCFGNHSRDDYHFHECILYSETDLRAKFQNAKESKNKNIKDRFILAFEELEKYIKNVKERYGDDSFVPTSSHGQPITDVNQHLSDMFPTAFTRDSQMAADDTELQYTLANDQHSADDNGESFNAITSHASQGYGSQYSGNQGRSYDSVESETQPQRHPRLRTASEIKTEYAQYYADIEAGNGPKILPQGSDADVETANTQRETRKRKNNDGSTVMGKPAAKRVTRAFERFDKSNDDIVVIDDEHDTERPSTSSQNHEKRSQATNDEAIETMLKEIDEIIEIIAEIIEYDENLKPLKEEKSIIKAKIMKGITDYDTVMTEYNEIAGKIAKIEREKVASMAKKAIVEAKLKKHLN